MHSEESVVHPLLHAWAHRLASVMEEREYAIPHISRSRPVQLSEFELVISEHFSRAIQESCVNHFSLTLLQYLER